MNSKNNGTGLRDMHFLSKTMCIIGTETVSRRLLYGWQG